VTVTDDIIIRCDMVTYKEGPIDSRKGISCSSDGDFKRGDLRIGSLKSLEIEAVAI
jgi:hypothetical protein